MEYRPLTEQEIGILESRGCKAQDWDLITVKEGFDLNGDAVLTALAALSSR